MCTRLHIRYIRSLGANFIVGYSNIVGSESSQSGSEKGGWQAVVGLILLIAALVIQGFYLVFEESILKKYEISPMRWAGTAGHFAMIHMFNYIVIFSFVPCPDAWLCTIGGSFEDPYRAIRDLWEKKKILFWCLTMMLSIAFYNFASLSLIQRVSSVYRSLWDSARTISVWVFSVALGLENFSPSAFPFQLCGFLGLLLGNFVYNEIVELKFCGLNKDLKKYQKNSTNSRSQTMLTQ